jgi:hypothetical protein
VPVAREKHDRRWQLPFFDQVGGVEQRCHPLASPDAHQIFERDVVFTPRSGPVGRERVEIRGNAATVSDTEKVEQHGGQRHAEHALSLPHCFLGER